MGFNFSNITDDLFIGTTPLASDYDGLRELGIQLIINMRFSRRRCMSIAPMDATAARRWARAC
jgi:hypothetical protein